MQASDMDKDNQIIIEYKNGDASAFDALVSQNLKIVYNIAIDYCKDPDAAEDIVQETFVKVWKHIQKFDTTKKFRPWLYQITRNTAMDYLRKTRPVPFSAFDSNVIENIAKDISYNYSEYQGVGASYDLIGLAEKLTPQQSSLLAMKIEDNLTFRQIAEKQKRPINTVKSQYLRIIKQLRDSLLR
ncbi:sigma-70 family RNA polymerase sigma factor [Patescibacteria group bacterium]|nr:sigma-70 family RNA polymerase sigma factor [Patescibacteria group bacterium]